IQQRLEELKASGTFDPKIQHVHFGTAIAVDAPKRLIFLANKTTMKLCSVDEIKKIEHAFKNDAFVQKILITVQDIESPFFEVQAVGSNKLREIDALLSILLKRS